VPQKYLAKAAEIACDFKMNIAEAETSRLFHLLEETSEVIHVAASVPIFPSRQLMSRLRSTQSADLSHAVEALWVLERAVSSSRATSPEKRRVQTPGSVASSTANEFSPWSSTSQLEELRKIWKAPSSLQAIQASTPLSAHKNEALLMFAGCLDDLVTLFRERAAKSKTELQSLQEYMQRKEQFIEKTEQQIHLASSELARQREVRLHEARVAQETIDKLTTDIEQLEKGHTDDMSALASNLQSTTLQDIELNKSRLQQTADVTNAEALHLQKSAAQHREAELDARKKQARVELELRTVISTYDTKMIAANSRVDHAQKVLTDVRDRVQKLRAYFAQKSQDDKAAKTEEAQDRREKHAQAVLQSLRTVNAAHCIGRYYKLKVLAPRAAQAQMKKLKAKKK